MAYPVSLATLIARVRQRSNLEGAVSFIPDSELTDYLNASIAAWYDVVRGSTWGGQYYRGAWPITSVASQSSYPLAPNTASIISVDANAFGWTFDVYAYQEEDRNWLRLIALLGWSRFQVPRYQLQGANINFAPLPQAGIFLTVNYVPTAPILTSPDDTLDSINGFDEWIVLDSAVKCLTKDGQLDIIPLLEQRRAEETARIKSMAPKRDMNQSEGVHETGQDDGEYGYWSF